MVNWQEIDPAQVAEYCKAYYERYSEYPSVRDIFYHFVDKLWANTESVYKRLSEWLRDQRLNGKIDWELVRDGAGREFEDNEYSYRTPREHVNLWLTLFTEIGGRYNLPTWLGQPKKVVVVCEKEADYPIIKALVGFGELNVDTAYARGYSGWKMLHDIAEKFKEEKKEPIIIALADFDPSGGETAKKEGKDLVSFILKAMLQLGVENVQVEKVLVTKEQIEKFKLPHRPEDAKEIEKLKRDPRMKTWPYGLYRVETAALRDRAPDYFDNLIKESVMKHFDQELHRKIQSEQERRRQRIARFFVDNADLIDELRDAISESEHLED